MEKWQFNFNSIKSFGDPIENTSVNQDPTINDMDKDILSGSKSDNSSYSNVDRLIGIIRNFISDVAFFIRDSYSIYFDFENEIFEIDNNDAFISEPANSELANSEPANSEPANSEPANSEPANSWNIHVNRSVNSYLPYELQIYRDILTIGENGSEKNFEFHNFVYHQKNESESSSTRISTDDSEISTDGSEISTDDSEISTYNSEISTYDSEISTDDSDLTIRESSNDLDGTQKYRHLWVQCDSCFGLNYKKFFKSKMNICEHCGYHLKMNSSDRIELLIDPGTWYPMDENMVSLDPIEFHSEEEPYKDRIDSYQKKTGLTEAVQTGTGRIYGIPVAIGVMDFDFMGGSMGSVVGEKITRLIEYATNQFLPLILVCASGGARMQEGSLSLMQMAKIASALYNYQSNKKLFYAAVLTSPTTGGVTASFGMLGDIVIVEPDAYIAFAGKRVIEQTLNKTVPDGSQVAEYLFDKGLFDPIVPRNILKRTLTEIFKIHDFLPLEEN